MSRVSAALPHDAEINETKSRRVKRFMARLWQSARQQRAYIKNGGVDQ
jgi:hypothetical protein